VIGLGARAPSCTLRPYGSADEPALIELWRRSWQATYPDIDFAARVDWWRTRWRDELVPHASIVVAEHAGAAVGFVTIDTATGYLDQIVVTPEGWGGGIAEALLNEAKRLSPGRVQLLVNKDNDRAISFYRKHGFAHAGDAVNSLSGRPVSRMLWRAQSEASPSGDDVNSVTSP
jgi:putative acetyltransferase